MAYPAIAGGCYCGNVRYKSTEPVYGMTSCYCSICRSVHGAPFATFTNLKRKDLQWTRKEALLSIAFSNAATRTVCRTCSAPITMVYNATPDEVGIVAASIDEELSTAPIPAVECHIYVDQKPDWYKILDDAPQHPGPTPDIQSNLEHESLENQSTPDNQIIRRGEFEGLGV